MFEHLLNQVASRHGLSPDQGRRLLAAWLDRIFDPARGGTAGFVRAFRDQGLEELAESWIAPGPNRPLTADQLERVFGEDEIATLARALDLPAAAVASASAAILPEAVDTLGEDGRWHGGGTAAYAGASDAPVYEPHRPDAYEHSPYEHSPHQRDPRPADREDADAPPASSPTSDLGGLHPIRDTAPGPLSSEPAPLYRADDDPPPPSPLLSFARRLWPWLLLFAFLSVLAWWLRV